jgi:peptidoglycan/xylan/chitin deacetylase (PgdA/CDA1 family)
MTDDNRPTRRHVLWRCAAVFAAPALLRPAAAQTSVDAGLGMARAPRFVGTPNPIRRMRTARPLVALSFDDGPHHQLTPQLLHILGARRIRATFFVLGNRAVHHPGILAQMVRDGHEIGNHTWSHPRLSGLSDAALLAQVDQAARCVADVVGREPVILRPPYGQIAEHQSRLISQERGLPTVLWSVDPQDWRRPGPTVVARRILDQVHPGAIVLCHDIVGGTIAAMPRTLDALIARGYAFVTVSELIGWPRWDLALNKS